MTPLIKDLNKALKKLNQSEWGGGANRLWDSRLPDSGAGSSVYLSHRTHGALGLAKQFKFWLGSYGLRPAPDPRPSHTSARASTRSLTRLPCASALPHSYRRRPGYVPRALLRPSRASIRP